MTENLIRVSEANKMGPKKNPSKDSTDVEAEKQFREEQIARELFQMEISTQLPKPKKKIVDIDDEKATLSSLINNKTLVPPENPRDPGSHLYCRILYVFGMTPKLMSVLRRMKHFMEEQIDEHINWFNGTFDANVTRVKEISYNKTTFGPRMSGLHKHTKLMEAQSATFNENKLIQEWVDDKIEYPYTPTDLGNRKYRQTIARTGFMEEIIAELMKRGFSHTQVDKHIRQIRQWFGFDVRTSGSRRVKHTPPAKLPEIIFTEERKETVPTTSSSTVTTTSSVTPATPSMSKSASSMGVSEGTVEQTIGSITMASRRKTPEERGQLPIVSTVISLSNVESTEDTGEQEMEIEYVSTVTKDIELFDPKDNLSGKDLQIKKEMVEEDLHPGDPNYYSNLQYVYQNWKETEGIVETTRGSNNYVENLQKCSSIEQIFENMKKAYSQHAKNIGKTLPEGWDTVNLAEPVASSGVKGMNIPIHEDPNYHPKPISHLKPNTMGFKEIEKYIALFEKEVQEINKIWDTGTAKDFTKAKMKRREELEDKIAEFEIEQENRRANVGEKRKDPKAPSRGYLRWSVYREYVEGS